MGKIVLKRDRQVIYRESQTFDTKTAAKRWLRDREDDLRENGLPKPSVTLADAINRYISESRRKIGRTKAQVLEALLRHPIAKKHCEDIRSADIVALAQRLAQDRQPQTVENYMSHLSAVMQIAGPAWGMPLDPDQMRSARLVANRLGLTSKSSSRHRRPTVAEIEALVEWFAGRAAQAMPMHFIIPFALFSTRRQDEITRIRWADLEPGRVLVRDMKHPGQKQGNDIWCDLPPEAEAIALAMSRRAAEIFPYASTTISANFTRACKVLGIEDLHFHDLRHEGVTRLFEMGWTIPQVAAVSGHRSWTSLKRYTHIRRTGDKWKDMRVFP